MKTGLIGYGHIGKWHAEKLNSLASVDFCALLDSSNTSQEIFKEKYPNIPIYHHIEDFPSDIEAIIISSPTPTHAQYIDYALSNNIHCFCEKPLCLNIKEVEEIIQKFNSLQSPPVLQVGHSERYHQAWEILENKFSNFLHESQTQIEIYRMGPNKSRALDTDVISDVMIHDLDLILYLFKEWPNKIYTKGRSYFTKTWDDVTVHLEFPSGRTAFLRASRNYFKDVRTFEMINSQGIIQIDLLNNKITHTRLNEHGEMGPQQDQYDFHDLEKRDHLLLEQEAFFDAIQGKTPVKIGAKEGQMACQLVAKILEQLN